ncbi:DUF4920 domain-containing protein [Brumicola pallidula]|jgi:hypothetical protein|uniref:DUF4920 domain-containing protein n=1 Tax=Brumicola pallidula DSM 14239 = ACAM 615 TaxID=1121922 RepID=K7A3B5_9ALTE|nr:DUF4920 domain-containing protein [Glaciecola pallidula]GAC29990.1 hypothetical protein GPAL_3139 [Glaciecola pallidula DSM 14239 = ACAM 615]
MKFQQFLSATVILSAMTLSTLASDMPDSNKMSNVLRLSVPVATDANSETFGVVLNKSLQKVTLNELAANSALYVGNAFQVDAKVAKVCQKKGCFFIAQQDDDVMRVAFRDYGFFVPTDSAGKTVTLAGELIKKEMTAEQVAHFNQDMQGGSDAMKEGVVYEIVADSVMIPKT